MHRHYSSLCKNVHNKVGEYELIFSQACLTIGVYLLLFNMELFFR